MPPAYYIDGYNVIHHSAVLRPLLEHDFEAAREGLIEKAARFCADTGARATVVFDGQGLAVESVPPHRGVAGLEVLYSADGQTADAVIERAVYLDPDPANVIVVTADRRIRELCMALNALVMAPDAFLATAREHRARVAASAEQLRADAPPHRIEDAIGPSAHRRLSRLRGRLDEGRPQPPPPRPRAPAPPPLEPPSVKRGDRTTVWETVEGRVESPVRDQLTRLRKKLEEKEDPAPTPPCERPGEPWRAARPVADATPLDRVDGLIGAAGRDALAKLKAELEDGPPAAPTRPPRPPRKKKGPPSPPPAPSIAERIEDRLDADTRERLRKLRDKLS